MKKSVLSLLVILSLLLSLNPMFASQVDSKSNLTELYKSVTVVEESNLLKLENNVLSKDLDEGKVIIFKGNKEKYKEFLKIINDGSGDCFVNNSNEVGYFVYRENGVNNFGAIRNCTEQSTYVFDTTRLAKDIVSTNNKLKIRQLSMESSESNQGVILQALSVYNKSFTYLDDYGSTKGTVRTTHYIAQLATNGVYTDYAFNSSLMVQPIASTGIYDCKIVMDGDKQSGQVLLGYQQYPNNSPSITVGIPASVSITFSTSTTGYTSIENAVGNDATYTFTKSGLVTPGSFMFEPCVTIKDNNTMFYNSSKYTLRLGHVNATPLSRTNTFIYTK